MPVPGRPARTYEPRGPLPMCNPGTPSDRPRPDFEKFSRSGPAMRSERLKPQGITDAPYRAAHRYVNRPRTGARIEGNHAEMGERSGSKHKEGTVPRRTHIVASFIVLAIFASVIGASSA